MLILLEALKLLPKSDINAADAALAVCGGVGGTIFEFGVAVEGVALDGVLDELLLSLLLLLA